MPFSTAILEVAVHGWPAHRKEPRGKLDGWAEAHLVVASCSPPPEGASRWTLKLLGDHLVRLQLVDSLSAETVSRTLKKTDWRFTTKDARIKLKRLYPSALLE
jgi:hypothetical protein